MRKKKVILTIDASDMFYKKQIENKSFKWLSFILGLLLVVVIIYLGGIDALKKVLKADIAFILISLGVTVILMLITAIRWGSIINSLEKRKLLSYPEYFHYLILSRSIGLLSSQTIGDFAGRPLILKASRKVTLKKGFLAILIERFSDLLLIVILSIPIATFLFGVLTISTVFICIFIMSFIVFWVTYGFKFNFLFINSLRLCSSGVRKLGRIIRTSITQVWSDKIKAFSDEKMFTQQFNIKIASYTVLRFILISLQFYFISVAIGTDIGFDDILISIPIAQLSLFLAFTPAGIGIYDFGWYGALKLSGVANSEIIPFILGQRAFLTVFTLLFTVIAIIVKKMQQDMKERTKTVVF